MKYQQPERIRRFFLALMIVSILSILSTVAAAGINDLAEDDKIGPEEFFQSIAGKWTYEGSAIIYNDTKLITGTRTITLVSPTSADYIYDHTMGDIQEIIIGEMWWDEQNQQFTIREVDDIFNFNLTSDGYEKYIESRGGIEEYHIYEQLASEEIYTIINETTHIHEMTAVNMDGDTILNMKTTYIRAPKDIITPEEIIQSFAGEWAYEGSMTIGNSTVPIIGIREGILTGRTSADFTYDCTIGDITETVVGSIQWDNETGQFIVNENGEVEYYNLTFDGYESSSVKERGIPDISIFEQVVLEKRATIVDETTHTLEWSAVNMTNETLMTMQIIFNRISDASTQFTVEVVPIVPIVPAISVTVTTSSLDFGKVGVGMSSRNQIITVVNTGTQSINVSAMIIEDDYQFYNESLKLDGYNIVDFSTVIPADKTDLQFEYDILANLEVPEWAGGTYSGTIFFIVESSSQ